MSPVPQAGATAITAPRLETITGRNAQMCVEEAQIRHDKADEAVSLVQEFEEDT